MLSSVPAELRSRYTLFFRVIEMRIKGVKMLTTELFEVHAIPKWQVGDNR